MEMFKIFCVNLFERCPLEISNVQLYVKFSCDPKSDNHSIFVWPFMIKGMGGRVYVSVLPWTIFVRAGGKDPIEEVLRPAGLSALQNLFQS